MMDIQIFETKLKEKSHDPEGLTIEVPAKAFSVVLSALIAEDDHEVAGLRLIGGMGLEGNPIGQLLTAWNLWAAANRERDGVDEPQRDAK